jgi:ribonuclease P protein component
MRKSRISFPGDEHLKRSSDISAVFKGGSSVSCAGARLFVRKNGDCRNRIAFAFSKKFGNAVKRNRARRLGREAYRHLRSSLKTGFDLVLLVYPDEKASFNLRLEQFKVLSGRAHLADEKCN